MIEYNKFPDNKLVILLKNGDHAAFLSISKRYKDIMISYAFRKLGNKENAGIVVENVLDNFWANRESLNVSRPDTYLFRLDAYLFGIGRLAVLSFVTGSIVITPYTTSLNRYLAFVSHDWNWKSVENELVRLFETELTHLPAIIRKAYLVTRKLKSPDELKELSLC